VRKQLVAALLAVVLAVAGVLVLLSYARGANDRAYAGVKLVEVLQVQTDVPAGTPVERLEKSVKLVKIPASVRIDGALRSLDGFTSKSTNAELNKGEQLLPSRFGSKKPVETDTSVPDGYQEVTILLGPPRVPAGKLKPGDRVGIIASYKAKNGDAGYTNFLQQQVRVTRVASTALADTGGGATAGVLVTLAVKTVVAEKVVNTAEFGMLHLTLQNSKTDTSGRVRISGTDVLK
jgi:pilus assembly protein CpaB